MILNRFAALIFFVVISLLVKAQQIHFIYLQTENSQPFYVKMDNKVTSSSSAGYLILPKLSEGNYNILVGFPKKEFPEESFQISVDKDNKGYLLKNFGEKGWGLFNLQSFAIVMGNSFNNDAPVTVKNLQDDPFSKMLANVVKDSSILEKSNVGELTLLPKNADSNIVIKNADTVAINNDNNTKIKKADTTVAIIDTITSASQNTQPIMYSSITRKLQKSNNDGIEMMYVDKDENNIDTIRIFLPADTSKTKDENLNIVKNDNSEIEKKDNIIETAIPDSTKKPEPSVLKQNIDSIKTVTENLSDPVKRAENKDSITSQLNNNHDSVSNILKPIETIDISGDEIKKQKSIENELPAVVNSSSTNSDCKGFASNDDFIKLRKKMAGENSDENMIKVAKKYFRSQCFSTEQIKNLSFLFLNDEGKYQFFDAAYAFTSDSSQYHNLQAQLKDPYYVNRFKAMIHK